MEHLSKDQIHDLVDGFSEKRAEWIAHIDRCEACRLEYESELLIHEKLKELPLHQPSMRFAKGVVELIEQNRKVDRAHTFWTKFTKYAISIAVVQSFIMLTYLFAKSPETTQFINSVEVINSIEETLFWGSTVALGMSISFWLLYLLDKRCKHTRI